ncbi:hypothetical protein [Leifsonia soli]|uniref:Glycosyltransferase RgtA/B/C/D-like domain-containing protein n=1 Tax=Leifsonia soli TaxID=582665 RepID=A0A852T0X4_9MICO|nr:hypothetical protein [Leifsonia soli]NYD74807.1 hypothetical protein [Leifsonia soli]
MSNIAAAQPTPEPSEPPDMMATPGMVAETRRPRDRRSRSGRRDRSRRDGVPGGDRSRNPFRSPALGSLLIGVIAWLLTVLRTLWPTVTGLADNGDGQRYVCQLGLVPTDASLPRAWSFAILDWMPGAVKDCVAYPSSQVWLLRANRWLTEALGGAPGHVDLRWTILGYTVVMGALVGAFAFAVRRGALSRVLLAGAFWLVLTDPAWANYAGSNFGEFPGILGVGIISVGAVLVGTSGLKQYVGLAMVGVGSLLAVTSKTQGVTLLVPLAVFLLCVTLRWRPSNGGVRWWRPARLAGAGAGRVLGIALAAALLAPVGWMLADNPKEFQAINPWEVISVGILGASDDPAKDLREMGLPEELSKFAGDSVWVKDSIMQSPEWEKYKHLMTYEVAARFLLAHPDRAYAIAQKAAVDFWKARPGYLGSYTADSGHAAQSMDVSPVAEFSRALSWGGLPLLALVWIALAVIGVRLIVRSTPGSPRRAFASAAVLMVSFAIVQFFTAAFGEAIENTKHMVYGVQAQSIATVFLVASALHLPDIPLPVGRRRAALDSPHGGDAPPPE